MRLLLILACIASLGFLPSTTSAQETAALINQALDRRVTYEWEQEPLPQVLATITQDTGVPLEVQPVVWELLPWGQETTITTNLPNLPLRDALRSIMRPLGLTFVLRDEVIQIRPVPALARLGRRATRSELQLLEFLSGNPINLETDRPSVTQLIEAVDQRLMQHRPAAEDPPPFDLEHRAHEVLPDEQLVFVPRNATLMAALESLVTETRATWHPFERTVLIIPKAAHTRARLARTLTIRLEGVDVGQVLNDLSQRSGVPFTIEPGAIQRIPADARIIRITLENATYAQALENLAGFTGLGFLIRDEDVYIWHQAPAPPAASPREPVIIIPLPELGIQISLPESQIPEDLRPLVREKMDALFENLRQMEQERRGEQVDGEPDDG